MELIKQRVHMNRCNSRENVQITLDADFNVPDIKPDARAVMQEKGEVVIEEIRILDGKVNIKGALYFTLLYAGEDEMPVCDLTGNIPISETVVLGCDSTREDEITVHTSIDDLRGELINSRKFGVKAIINMEVLAETVYDGEGAIEIEGDESILKRKKSMDITRLILSKKDTLRVRDECKIPGTKDTIGRILYDDVNLLEVETRVGEDKLVLSGEASLFIIYLSADESPQLNFHECVIPLAGEVNCGGCDETNVVQAEVGIHSREIEVKSDEDGEDRVIDVEIVLDLAIKAFGEERMELLTDFYSTKKECTPVFETSYFENLILKNKSKSRVNGRIQMDSANPPLQIWKVTGDVRVDEKRIVEDGVEVEGIIDINVLYQSVDNTVPLAACAGVLPFEQHIQVPDILPDSDIRMTAGIEQISGSLLGENEADIKAVVVIDVLAFNNIEEPIIADFNIEELDCDARAREPGLIGYVVKNGEELWDIAKEFYTTIDTIMEINKLESDQIHEGDVLLVMKEANCA
ncbi:MAG: DUF3794 domain-containing protein [Roseburia sp.]|nr:DUF3794 domain-containing protein [Roseburia sp.]